MDRINESTGTDQNEIFKRDELSGVMVSNCGNVIGLKGFRLKLAKDRDGYLKAHVREGSRGFKWVGVHRLVARNFVENPNPQLFTVVNHKDEIKDNNHAYNLEWCTNAYNLAYGTSISRRLATCDARNLKNARKSVCICSPKGEKFTFKSRCAAARHIGCKTSDICSLISGNQLSIKGWHLEGTSQWGEHREMRRVRLEKDGVVREWASLREAGRSIGASGGEVARIADGRGMSVNGWHLPGVKVIGSTAKREVSLEKCGEVKSWKSLADAAREIGTSSSSISKVLKGVRDTAAGWHLVGASIKKKKKQTAKKKRSPCSRGVPRQGMAIGDRRLTIWQ